MPVASPMLINSEELNIVPQDAFSPSLSPMANAYRGGGSERLVFFRLSLESIPCFSRSSLMDDERFWTMPAALSTEIIFQSTSLIIHLSTPKPLP